jgi:hypothetical protein
MIATEDGLAIGVHVPNDSVIRHLCRELPLGLECHELRNRGIGHTAGGGLGLGEREED